MIGQALPRRLARIGSAALFDLALPLALAVGLVWFLADPNHIDTSELRANSLLMNARSIFRVVAPGDELRVALGTSLLLLGLALGGAIAIGVPAGIAFAWSTWRLPKAVVWALATIAAALPAFFWAIALELVVIGLFFGFGVRILPGAGFGVDEHLILPVLALALRPTALVFQFTAVAVDEVRHAEFVRTAVAKGLSDGTLLRRHVLPNAWPSIVSGVVLAARGILSSLAIVEYVYIWGGAGLLFVQALGLRHLELATEIALLFALGSAVLTVLADLARARIPVRA
jgi:peptide/nickel transport system permease protein